MRNTLSLILSGALLTLAISGCQKMDRPELAADFPTDDNQVLLPGDLRFYASFNPTDGPSPRWNAKDSISGNPALLFPTSYEPGISGNALKGTDNAGVLYLNANDFKTATSFSVSYWIKSEPRPGRTEFLFSLVEPNFAWHGSALFLLLENQTTTNLTMKFGVKDKWLEGTFPRPMFDNSWHHVVFSYDNTTKKMTYYFDGQVVQGLSAAQTDVTVNVDFTKVTNLILGGWNKHGSKPGPADDWIKSYLGLLDQFRLYNKALSASEALALFNAKL